MTKNNIHERLAQLAELYAAGDIGPDGWHDAQFAIYITGTGQVVRDVHPPTDCAEREFCAIHAPSPHLMRTFPTHFRFDRYLMERICDHGVGHPDPDDVAYQAVAMPERMAGVHGCDGCCVEGGMIQVEEDRAVAELRGSLDAWGDEGGNSPTSGP